VCSVASAPRMLFLDNDDDTNVVIGLLTATCDFVALTLLPLVSFYASVVCLGSSAWRTLLGGERAPLRFPESTTV
jgi:hypothetical protein